MHRANQQLRDDAIAIWRAGVSAVDSRRLVCDTVHVDGNRLMVGDESLSLLDYRKIVVVGGGKAGAGMADGLEQALGLQVLQAKQVSGWVNVPADCIRQLRCITLHAARPAGINEPTEAGVEGTNQILELIESLTPQDLCICLLSGGGSALLPAPVEGITLADKQSVTKYLSAAGANIRELNTVRKQLSRIKGGGLARACGASRLITLIISDVLGDPLDVIASGPTVDDTATASDALLVLEKYQARQAGISPTVFTLLQRAATVGVSRRASVMARVSNRVIGNNATAVDAAGAEAERLGYAQAMVAAKQLEGPANDIGRHHARMATRMRCEPGPNCLITGGEPTVQLVEASRRGKGGRNQQLVLAALCELLNDGPAEPRQSLPSSQNPVSNPLDGIVILSGGTDGEDGPTDAAGAWIDSAVWEACRKHGRVPDEYLRRNDAYHFFEPLGRLLKTGPTHTNVCDVRVVVVNRE